MPCGFLHPSPMLAPSGTASTSSWVYPIRVEMIVLIAASWSTPQHPTGLGPSPHPPAIWEGVSAGSPHPDDGAHPPDVDGEGEHPPDVGGEGSQHEEVGGEGSQHEEAGGGETALVLATSS